MRSIKEPINFSITSCLPLYTRHARIALWQYQTMILGWYWKYWHNADFCSSCFFLLLILHVCWSIGKKVITQKQHHCITKNDPTKLRKFQLIQFTLRGSGNCSCLRSYQTKLLILQKKPLKILFYTGKKLFALSCQGRTFGYFFLSVCL